MTLTRYTPLLLALALTPRPAQALGEPQHIVFSPTPNTFPLSSNGKPAPIFVDPADFPGVQRAAHSFAADIQSVTGSAPRLLPSATGPDIILIGTIGHSPVIDTLIAQHKLDVAAVRGQWETSVTQVVDRPLPGVRRALVIAGADKRGTIFAIYDLSEQIGVSPWTWWADVPVQHHANLFLLPGRFLQPVPAVKYRGIFLNDEAPALSGWTQEKFGGMNHLFYQHVFELLLRLKANFLWPAMWNNAFNEDDPADPALADDYGIVMGTSHHEPMMRAQQEWKRHGTGPWDYSTNSQVLNDFWRTGVRRNRNYEQLTTIGMRGDGDMAMSAGTNTALLEHVVADQRKILTEEVNPDITRVPQVWALYKEVQDYYEAGMRVPDDVTLLWCDDNWGNLRRLPTPAERLRPGGAGIYYHFDYVGGPRNYKWLNTNPIPKLWEQMNLALNYGADRMWIVNVGDLKPMEFPIEFFLSLARTPQRWGKDHLDEYTQLWAAREFGPEHAQEIAQVLTGYTAFNGLRKPELIDANTFSNQDEADQLLAGYKATVAHAEALSAQLAPQYRDAFFELVLFPAKASEQVLEMNILAGRNQLYARQARASTNDLAAKVQTLFQQDAALTAQYNHTLAHGKWNHMMDQTHLGYFSWQEPPANIMPPVSVIGLAHGPVLGTAIEGQTAPATLSALPPFDPYTRTTHYVDLFNSGDTPVQYTVSAADPWLTLSTTSGTIDHADVRLTIAVDWSKLPAGALTSSITIAQLDGAKHVIPFSVSASQAPTRADLQGFMEQNGTVSISAEHYSAIHPGTKAHWERLPNFGKTLSTLPLSAPPFSSPPFSSPPFSSMTLFPVTAASTPTPGQGACLDYQVYLVQPGDRILDATLAPTLKFVPGRGLRFSLYLDSQPPTIVDAWASDTPADWEKAVSDGFHHTSTLLTTPTNQQPGYHTLHVCSVDPGVVLERLVLRSIPASRAAGRPNQPYLGPPESFHAQAPPRD